jgi:hypothetical protein
MKSSYNGNVVSDLLALSARTNRGEFASTAQKEAVSALITELEASNPAYDDKEDKLSLKGSWDLIYTDAQLFQSSPFFLAVRELLGDSGDRAKEIFSLHRAATANGAIERVQQIITDDELISKVSLNVGLLPGQPFSVRGVVVTNAESKIEDKLILKVKVKETRIEDSNIPLANRVGLFNRTVPVAKIIELLRREIPESQLTTFYLDDTLRITRNKDDNVFVYIRTKEE